jgi:hypothetical protein
MAWSLLLAMCMERFYTYLGVNSGNIRVHHALNVRPRLKSRIEYYALDRILEKNMFLRTSKKETAVIRIKWK